MTEEVEFGEQRGVGKNETSYKCIQCMCKACVVTCMLGNAGRLKHLSWAVAHLS